MGRAGRSALALAFGAIGALAAACGGVKEEVTLVFPSQAAREVTKRVAFSAFTPLITRPGEELPQFVSCEGLSTFPPIRTLDPGRLGEVLGLEEVQVTREAHAFPLEGDWVVGFRPPAESPTNPWGLVMVYIEALGEARLPPERGATLVNDATLLSGCYCVRTRSGGHPDRKLDQDVKKACEELTPESQTRVERILELKPVAPREFRVEACGAVNLTAPKNDAISPRPSACLQTVRCDDAPLSSDCFRCAQPCRELEDLGNAPILFTVDQPGGGAAPTTQVALTDARGRARAQITVDDCARPISVRAQVVGRDAAAVSFRVDCVEPVREFECGEELRLRAETEPVSLTTLPGEMGQPDSVVVAYFDGLHSAIEVLNPRVSVDPSLIAFPEETMRAVHGFHYEPGPTRRTGRRPALAVVTSVGQELRIRVYEWRQGVLVPHDDATGIVEGPCRSWSCGSLASCSGQEGCAGGEYCQEGRCVQISPELPMCTLPQPVRCGCDTRIEFQSEISVATADIDGDGFADLAIGHNNDLPITTYFSGRARPGTAYSAEGCACAKFGQSPTGFELVRLGGPGTAGSVDLVIGSPGGAYVKYATESPHGPVLACGQSMRFGDLVPVRDVVRGRFACEPGKSSATCEGLEDVVLVAARSLGGGSFNDPGNVRVVFGSARDVSATQGAFEQPGASVELIPRSFAGRGEPRDPRSGRVADFNGDGFDDLAVLYFTSEEVHVWLGAGNRGLGEVARGVVLEDCPRSLVPASKCTPLRRLTTPDFDGDGRSELALVCEPSGLARLRWYAPRL